MFFELGDLVRVKRSFLGNPENALGYIYDTYEDFDNSENQGVCIILHNGADLGGFSYEEQQSYLDKIKESGFHYEFQNVIKLSHDYQDGKFDRVFNDVSI